MNEEPDRPPPRRDRPRPARRGAKVIILAAVVAMAVVFFIGLVVGMAIEDAPRPGGEQTIVRTLVPATVGPPSTVTVTVGEP